MLGLRVTFDSPASKPVPTGSQDIDVHGRQVGRGRDDDSQPASRPRGGQERSSIRKTSNLKPRQEGGCPTGMPHNIPSSSTLGKPSPQPGGIMRASPRNPLKNITNYRSAGWRKDLAHILGSFYHYNNPSHKEAEWNKWKTKFFKYLGQRQGKWRAIKEEKPLQYMPYMESCFQALISIRLKGLSQLTGWIKSGSYYHGVVAKKGQLHLGHLAGTMPPKGPQIHPSQSHPVTQKEEETPTTSPHRSLSRKWEGRSTNPFLLQDSKGRHEAVQQLYMADGGFQGTRDLRVLEKAKTLQVAVWLHCLDMAATGDGMASYSLDATQHGRGPLLEFLLAPQASSLTFEEVIHWVLAENWYKIESSLDDIQELQAQLQREAQKRLIKWSLPNLLERR